MWYVDWYNIKFQVFVIDSNFFFFNANAHGFLQYISNRLYWTRRSANLPPVLSRAMGETNKITYVIIIGLPYHRNTQFRSVSIRHWHYLCVHVSVCVCVCSSLQENRDNVKVVFVKFW